MITADYVRTLLNYDPETGIFSWTDKAYKNVKGKKAGYPNANKYLKIRINYKQYSLHRIAWLIVYGVWPENQIDHIDGNRQNNKIANLRDVSGSMNQHNRKGFMGVVKNKNNGKPFRARIKVNGKEMNLGRFDTAEDAHKAYLKAKRKFHEGYVE